MVGTKKHFNLEIFVRKSPILLCYFLVYFSRLFALKLILFFKIVTVNLAGIAAFEIEYSHWVEEQHRQICELRNALQAHITEIELHILVDNGMNHYHNLFRMKADATKADVFYIMSGVWRTSTERFFLWIGGFRPSELLNVMSLVHLISALEIYYCVSVQTSCLFIYFIVFFSGIDSILHHNYLWLHIFNPVLS